MGIDLVEIDAAIDWICHHVRAHECESHADIR